jgi:hypothetical protein
LNPVHGVSLRGVSGERNAFLGSSGGAEHLKSGLSEVQTC